MRIESTFLRSRFGQRIFLLFASCALLPIVALALISYISVNRELVQQAEGRLADESKSIAMGIWDRLTLLDSELQIKTSEVELQSSESEMKAKSIVGESVADHFRGIVIEVHRGQTRVARGAGFEPPRLSAAEVAHLDSGRPLLTVEAGIRGEERFILGRRLEAQPPDRVTGWGEIEPSYLWWGATLENTLPAVYELTVLDQGRENQIHNTLKGAEGLAAELPAQATLGSLGNFQWHVAGTRYLAHYRVMNLRPAFLYPSLTLVVSEPEDSVFQPLASFKRWFLCIFAATLLSVMLLSIRQIRSSLIPLERLQAGTRQLASGKLGANVQVESRDEFAELASAFNSMARNLESQFATLESLNQLQQAVLSALDTKRIAGTVLDQFERIFPCEQVSISLLKPDCAGAAWIYSKGAAPGSASQVEAIELVPQELEALSANRHHLEVRRPEGVPGFFVPVNGVEFESVVAFPAFLAGELVAVIAAGRSDTTELDPKRLDQARQLTDQVAIALSNIRLVEQLDDLNWGTLSALARAIDVRSHWTMGHTERVTNLAQQTGREMGLPKERLDTLQRASLLHDIGKIGVPSEILDKPGKLTTEEMDKIREHVRLGVRIIEPIPALSDTIPVVLQHHEWFNGQGYPGGLSGTEICLEARILSVADCYDALRSTRPYRGALSHDSVVEYLCDGAGGQFDPQVVEVFLKTFAEPRMPTRPPATSSAVSLPLESS